MYNIKRIVIVGGGAAGLEIVTLLGNLLGKTRFIEITLIDQNLCYIWKPLWHEIAAGRIDVNKDVTEYLAHGNEHAFKFILGSFYNIDRQAKVISLAPIATNGIFIPENTLYYDILIFALGSVHNDFNIEGASKYCLSFDSIEECNTFHNLLIMRLFELMQTDQDQIDIVIVGGGSTGIELVFEINNTIHNTN